MKPVTAPLTHPIVLLTHGQGCWPGRERERGEKTKVGQPKVILGVVIGLHTHTHTRTVRMYVCLRSHKYIEMWHWNRRNRTQPAWWHWFGAEEIGGRGRGGKPIRGREEGQNVATVIVLPSPLPLHTRTHTHTHTHTHMQSIETRTRLRGMTQMYHCQAFLPRPLMIINAS